MAINIPLLQEFTMEDVARGAMHAIMTANLGGADLTINGRRVGRVTPKEARETYDWAMNNIAIAQAGNNGGGNILVNFNR